MQTMSRFKPLRPKILLEWALSPELTRAVRERFGSGERQGVPKGERIGPSKGKFLAAVNLLFLGSPACKTLAKVVRYPFPQNNFNASVLRVWRAQPEFQQLVAFLTWDLARHYVAQIVPAFAADDPKALVDQLFDEFPSYGIVLQQAIITLLAEALPSPAPKIPFMEKGKWRQDLSIVMQNRPSTPSYAKSERTQLVLFFISLFLNSRNPIGGLNISTEDKLRFMQWLCWNHRLLVSQQAKAIRRAVCADEKEAALRGIGVLEGIATEVATWDEAQTRFARALFQR